MTMNLDIIMSISAVITSRKPEVSPISTYIDT